MMSLPGPASAQFNQQLGNQVLDLIEALGANALNQFNRIGSPDGDHGYRADMRMSEPFENAGYGPVAATALGVLGLMALPDPMDAARAAKAVTRTADVMQPVMNSRTGRPLELWRAEMPGGRGPIAADSGFQGSGRYFGEAPYVQDLAANPARSGAVVRQAQVMGRPGAVLDIAQEGVDNSDLMRRVLNSAVEQAPDPNTRRYLEGLSIQYGRGEVPDADVVRMLRNTFSGDLSGVASRSGMDSLIQFADDMADPRYLEAVVFNPSAVRDVNAPLEAAEFLQLLQGR